MSDTDSNLRQISFEDEWFRVLAESSLAAVVVFRGRRILYANPTAEELSGYSVEELVAMGDVFDRLVAPEHRDDARERSRARLDGEEVADPYRLKLRRRGGEERWLEVSGQRIRWAGEPANLATVVDFTRDSRPREALSRANELAEVTLASIGEGVIRTDAEGCIDYMNPVAERLTGWPLDEAVRRDLGEVYQVVRETPGYPVHHDPPAGAAEKLYQAVEEPARRPRRPRRNPVEQCLAERRTIVLPGLFTLCGRDGREFTIRDSVAPILRGDAIIGTVVVFRDLTRVRGLEQELARLASHDPLTGLLNRQELEIYLEVALESIRQTPVEASRGATSEGPRKESTLLYLDLWEFKLVNDCYGLVAGDELLRQVAELLRRRVEKRGILARLGGDEFGILLEGTPAAEALDLARELRRAVRDFRFSWGGQHFEVGLSIGVVPITAASESVGQLFKAADAACYLAQRAGRNKIHTFVPDDAAVAERYGRLHWIQRIRRSLSEDRFCLYHQRIRPLGGEPPMHEILVRMIGDDGSHVAPGQFIPIVEDHDLAPSLDRWVVRRVLERLTRDDNPALVDTRVTINLSGQSLGDESFLDELVGSLEASRVPRERIYFEITETAAVAHLARALHFIRTVKDTGCRFILDDFGSGMSSFAYLKNLPVDVLKIDGEFVRSMEDDPIRRAMVEAINQIGQVMGLKTIAEWVETEATYEMLHDLGVDYVQGFWIHRPEEL